MLVPVKAKSALRVTGLVLMVIAPVVSSVPPLMVNVPVVPSAPALPTVIWPALRITPPVKVLAALSTKIPEPFWITLPEPLMAAVLKLVPWVTVSVRLKASVALLVIALLVESAPVVLPLPSCKVPALIRVAPV